MVKASTSVIDLGTVFDISVVERYQPLFLLALASDNDTALDASNIERVDSAALQLCWSFRLSAQQQGMNLSWLAPNDKLKDTARLLGMSTALGLAEG